jgi:hypothetical protein
VILLGRIGEAAANLPEAAGIINRRLYEQASLKYFRNAVLYVKEAKDS